MVRLAFLLLLGWMIAGCGKPAGPPAGNANPSAVNKPPNATAANTASNPPAPEAMLTKALFEDRPNAGRDPFFPNSERRQQQSAQAASEPSKPALPPSEYLRVTALVIKAKPVAWINGALFSPGDRGEVAIVFTNSQNTIETRKIIVRCHSVQKNSVSVSVEGESGVKNLRVP